MLIFFVLSGYLITGILVSQRIQFGRLRLMAFYVRRIRRIWPAFYVFLACMAMLAAAHFISISGVEELSAAMFVWNYSPVTGHWWLAHTWSLAVEEQFYLLWPLALLLLAPRKAIKVGLAIIACAPLIRTAEYLLLPGDRGHLDSYFHTRADALMLGSVLALLPGVYPVLRARVGGLVDMRRVQAAMLVCLFVVYPWMAAIYGGRWTATVGFTLAGVCTGLLIVMLTGDTTSWIKAVFESRTLVWFGLISYSLYLWQQPFLTVENKTILGVFGINIAVAVACAAASRRFIEEPFLR